MSGVSSGSGYRLRQSLWFFLLVFWLVAAPIMALEITEAELARLESIWKELEAANSELTLSLEKAQKSFDEYVSEVEGQKAALRKEADRWRTAFVWTVGTAVVTEAVLLVLCFVKH